MISPPTLVSLFVPIIENTISFLSVYVSILCCCGHHNVHTQTHTNDDAVYRIMYKQLPNMIIESRMKAFEVAKGTSKGRHSDQEERERGRDRDRERVGERSGSVKGN